MPHIVEIDAFLVFAVFLVKRLGPLGDFVKHFLHGRGDDDGIHAWQRRDADGTA